MRARTMDLSSKPGGRPALFFHLLPNFKPYVHQMESVLPGFLHTRIEYTHKKREDFIFPPMKTRHRQTPLNSIRRNNKRPLC